MWWVTWRRLPGTFLQAETGAADCSPKTDIWFSLSMWLPTNSGFSCVPWLLLACTNMCFSAPSTYRCLFNCGFRFLCIYPRWNESLSLARFSVLLRPRFQNQFQAHQGQECSWCWYSAIISPFFYPKGGPSHFFFPINTFRQEVWRDDEASCVKVLKSCLDLTVLVENSWMSLGILLSLVPGNEQRVSGT